MAEEVKKEVKKDKVDKKKWIQGRLKAINKIQNPAKAKAAAARILNNR